MNLTVFDKAASYIEANNMVVSGDGIVIGVSGGADSVCLLFLLYELREKYSLRLQVVHINHGIREEAGEDAAFVEKLCAGLKVPCDIVKKDVPSLSREWKMSEEEAGRRVRYEAFEEAAHKYSCNKIAVAHNMNDEAETVLFHMFRGSGLHGLTGIPAVRAQSDLEIIRPIKCLSRAEIEGRLREAGISWITDKTNLEDKYARNRIRHNILPEAEGVAPGAVKHICEVAAQLAETEQLLEELEKDCLRDCISESESDSKINLDALKLSKYHTVIRKRAILTCLKKLGGGKDIGLLQVEQVNELVERVGNRKINLAKGISAERIYDSIVMCSPGRSNSVIDGNISGADAPTTEGKYQISIEEIMLEKSGTDIEKLLETVCLDDELNKYTKWLDYDRINGQLEVRSRKSGDYLLLVDALGEFHRKSLKDFMIDMKIPAAMREKLPVVACGSHCLWLVGYRISDFCKLTPDTKRVVKLSCNINRENE